MSKGAENDAPHIIKVSPEQRAEALRAVARNSKVKVIRGECIGCECLVEHDGDYGSSGHAGPCPPHTCVTPPG